MATFHLDPEPAKGNTDLVVGDAGQRGKDRILLGKLAEAGPTRRLWLDISGEQVVAIFGKRGTGKSYTLGVLLEGLSAGSGTHPIAEQQTPRAGLVLDIMDIYWSSQIPLTEQGPPELVRQYELMKRGGYKSQALNIDVWIPAGFERPEIDPPGLRTLVVPPWDMELDDWANLFSVDLFNEPRGMLIVELLSHVSQQGYIRQDGTSVSAIPQFGFRDLLDCLESDSDLNSNYRPDTIRAIRQRMNSYASLPLFGSPGTSMTELLVPFRTSVLMLGRLPDALKKVLVAVLLRRLLRERRDASLAQKRLDLDSRITPADRIQLQDLISNSVPRTWILLDEAHVLASSEEQSVAGEALIKYAKEGRNYGLSLGLATQQPSALDQRLTSQVETLIVHQLTSLRDANVATGNMRSPAPVKMKVDGSDVDMPTLLRRLSQGIATFSSGNAPELNRVCVTTIRPRITAHGGYEA